MADNYLEKRYREVFGEGSRVDPETGYESSGPKPGTAKRFPLYPQKSVPKEETNDKL